VCTHAVVCVMQHGMCGCMCVHRCVWVRGWGVHGVWEGVRGVGEKEECL